MLLCGCSGSTPDHPFSITVFSVGKADAILIRADGHTMMIDCGEQEDEAFLLHELEGRGITHLDVLQITHFDKDHVGSAASIVNALDIDRIMYPDYVGTRKEYSAFAAAAETKGGGEPVTESIGFALGTASVTVFPASDAAALTDEDKEYDNELSLVTRIEYGSRVFLMCGDVEKGRIKQMLADDTDWSCDWIKLPHHGKYEKRLSELLKSCRPRYSVMTVSVEEPADDKTVELLEELGIESYDTLGGNVVTFCDGESIVIQAG